MGLTKSANDALDRMPESHVDDLCNAIASMGFTERREFINSLAARAPKPLKVDVPLTRIEAWWEKKIRSGVMLPAGHRDEGWLREVPVAQLTKDYVAGTERHGITERGAATSMGRFLTKVMPKLKTVTLRAYVDVNAGEGDGARYRPGTVGQVKGKVRYYQFPAREVARQFWLVYLAQRG